jgi:hypothetical protein
LQSNTFEGMIFKDDISIPLQIDAEQVMRKGREIFNAQLMDIDVYNEYLRYCTLKELPMILDSLSRQKVFNEESAIILTRLDSNWRNSPLTRDAVNKQIQTLVSLVEENEGNEMYDRINVLNNLDPQWRKKPEIQKQIRLFVEKMKEEAKSSWDRKNYIWPALALQTKEADQLITLWWKQQDDEGYFRDSFVRACIFLKQKKFIPLLNQSLKWNSEENEDMREDILWAFGYLVGPETHSAILKGLRDGSVEVRQNAAIASGKQKIVKEINALEIILKTDNDRQLVKYSAKALSRIEKSRTIPFLIQALNKWQNDPEVACRIIAALSVWDTPEIETAMIRFLQVAEKSAHESADSDKNKFYLSYIQPDAGVEGTIRWAIRNNRKTIEEYIAPFSSCSSPRHRALAQTAAYYFENTK